MSLSTAPCSRGHAAMTSLCCFGPAGFDVKYFTIELELLTPCMKVYCHHLPCQGWTQQELELWRLGCRKGQSQRREQGKNWAAF